MSRRKRQPVTMSDVVRIARESLSDAGAAVWRWKWWYLLTLAVAGPLLWYLMRFDPVVLGAVRTPDSPFAMRVASFITKMGETQWTTLILYAILLFIGIVMRRERVLRVALCLMLAVIVSGIGVNILRASFGRARPYAVDAGSFNGFSTKHQYNSFPSGHSSEAWTVATIVSGAYPPATIPACAYAGSMMWARMEQNQHFPVDVLGGAIWGVLCTLPFAAAARRKPSEPPEKKKPEHKAPASGKT
jgi:membrane-associated phospholipid phosphatase